MQISNKSIVEVSEEAHNPDAFRHLFLQLLIDN